MAGSHLMAAQSDGDVSRGIVRDAPRSSLPPGSLYDAADYLLHEPGIAIKRGGTTYAGPALAGETYAKSVVYAPFPAGAKLVATGSTDNHVFTVAAGTTTDVTTTVAPTVDKPKLRIGGGKNLLIFPNSDGATGPTKYDGSANTALLGGTPAAGKFCAVYKTRLVLGNSTANPNRLYFSPTPDIESTWDTTNSWIDCDNAITGLAATANMLLVFSQGAVERIIGSTPPPGSDMQRDPIAGSVGCTDARSIVVQENNVLFANPRGVYLTNGAGFASLTDEGLIATYWQSLFTSYDPSTWIISAGVYRTFYFISVVDNNGNLVTSLMCNVPRRAWWRLTNIAPTMYSQAIGAQEELYYADRSTNRVVKLSGIFSPSSSNQTDANGTAVTPLMEFQMIGGGPGLKAFGNGRLFYDMRDGGSAPTMSVQVAPGLEATTYAAVPESPLAATTDATRKRFKINKDATGVSVKLQQTNASSKTEIYDIEIESRVYPQTRDGQ